VRFSDWLLDGKDPEKEIEINLTLEEKRSKSLREFLILLCIDTDAFKSKNMQSSYQYCFKNICRCPQLADRPLKSFTKDIMLDYMHKRIKNDGVSPSTVNKEMNFVRCMLARAVDWGLLEQNPLRGLKKFR